MNKKELQDHIAKAVGNALAGVLQENELFENKQSDIDDLISQIRKTDPSLAAKVKAWKAKQDAIEAAEEEDDNYWGCTTPTPRRRSNYPNYDGCGRSSYSGCGSSSRSSYSGCGSSSYSRSGRC